MYDAVKRVLAGGACAAIISIAGLGQAFAAAPESPDPVKIALLDWTSVNLNAKILGGILTKLGYNVEYPTADYLSSLTTVQIGALSATGFSGLNGTQVAVKIHSGY